MAVLLFIKKGKFENFSFVSSLQNQDLKNKFPSDPVSSFSFGHSCIEVLLDTPLSREELVDLRLSVASDRVDVLQMENHLNPKEPSLFCFDMDSTVIQEEVIDELARKHGVYEQVASVTKQAMDGGMGFEEALRKRVILLNGLSRKSFGEVYELLHLNSGMDILFQELPKLHTKISILSGGFTPVLDLFAKKYPVSFYRANHLEEKDGIFTGEILGEIIGKEKKAEYLNFYSKEQSILKEQIVAVGDGANDGLMLQSAHIGIGFHAKQGLKDQILNWIDFSDMSVLLFLFRPTT
ncbi:phosphoserine phosphatase SerB [Leptospira kobayashii]|uniref:Phosphoserine phosphatase n=1 Tax=Leptospira kobayashii TaxID=1917830 RepID=A0ABM7UT50_9LEPT|nr:phosphoserine phosphatase SerB [Leptospira kobayashii]BDA79793.1 phosphoserine phosphatase SerB [Leptospira kobayashii]